MRFWSERGAGTVLLVAILAAVTTVSVGVTLLGPALAARQRVITAADSAALAAADVALGAAPGDPCTVAATVANANGAVLTGCTMDGAVALVTVESEVLGVVVTASSRAGPPR